MNLLQISLTNRCNMDCAYCPIAEWRNNPAYPNLLSNEILLPFLKSKINPGEWHIELTGGEPALYGELPELLRWLHRNGYKGLVKTNGTLPIPAVPCFKRVAAFHDLGNPPVFFDEILILRDKRDAKPSAERQRICIANNWKYKFIELTSGGLITGVRISYKKMLFITPDGKLRPCNADRKTENWLPDWVEPREICGHCKAAHDFEIFMEALA